MTGDFLLRLTVLMAALCQTGCLWADRASRPVLVDRPTAAPHAPAAPATAPTLAPTSPAAAPLPQAPRTPPPDAPEPAADTCPDVSITSVKAILADGGFLADRFAPAAGAAVGEALQCFQAANSLRPSGVKDVATCQELCRCRAMPDAPGCRTAGPCREAPQARPGDAGAAADPPAAAPAPATQPKAAAALSLPTPALRQGEPVLAVETTECRGENGNWTLFYEGRLESIGPESGWVTVLRRYAMRHHPSALGISSSTWWCIPKRRFCYAEVDFTGWQGTHRANQLVAFPAARIVAAKEGIVAGIGRLLKAACQ